MNFFYRNGFPAAFMYSSSVNKQTCITFYNELRKVCNISKPKVFMSDDFPGYYNAWEEVFGPVQNHLLCIWHVFKNWNKHLNEIKDNDLRLQMRSDLFQLQKTLEEKEFVRLFNFFKNKYSCNATNFIKYLETYYENKMHQWAACYRVGLGINTNMYLESLHR